MVTTANWTLTFPGLSALAPEHQARLAASCRVASVPAGVRLFGPGQPPSNYLLLLTGSVRVQQASDGGREIVLYRVQAGESCALTTACLVGDEPYQAEGVTETDISAVLLPRAAFEDLIASSPEFRRFVFTSFGARLTNLFRLIEDVAFARIDIRLAQKLLERGGPSGVVALTHQQLAAELGTAREVVSRQLNEFQRRGWVTTSRGTISIDDAAGLRQLSALP